MKEAAGLAATAALACFAAAAQAGPFVRVRYPAAEAERITGAALVSLSDSAAEVYTWGDRLLRWTVPGSGAQVLLEAGSHYGEGGCLEDVNGDGQPDLILLEKAAEDTLGQMVWLEAPAWRRHLIDEGALFSDCLAATLNGRRGILVIHRYTQLRFYQIPADPEAKWPYQEIYSIYTPSLQGGLALADVDRDGFQDILCGNYWLRNPGREGVAWRLFAINLWFETPESSLLRLAVASRNGGKLGWLVAGQREMVQARLAWFQRPDKPTALWRETRLEGRLRLRRLRGLATGDFDGDGDDDVAAGEDAGSDSRLVVFYKESGHRFRPEIVDRTEGSVRLWTVGNGPAGLLSVERRSVSWWRNQRRR